MNIPQFTAQASLYRSGNHYRSPGLGGEWQKTVVTPQLGGPGFEGLANCLMDCADQHPDWSAARCRTICRDPGGTGSGGVGYGPNCENSPPMSCYLWLAACCPFGGLFGCAAVCTEFVHLCLEDSRRECLIARHGPLTGGSSYPATHGVGLTP
jgi:hypothetical protein